MFRWWTRFLAYFRLSEKAVCEASEGMGLVDYHTRKDAGEGTWPLRGPVSCRRCDKLFVVKPTGDEV